MIEDPACLDGKLAIVTGGGSGIGEATARVFAEAGATVIVTDRRLARLTRSAMRMRMPKWVVMLLPVMFRIKTRRARCSQMRLRSTGALMFC